MLETHNLNYAYHRDQPVLQDIHFTTTKGKITGVIGANGCGKSTLFLNLMGLLKPVSGKIEYNKVPLQYDKTSLYHYRKEVTMLLQDPEKQIFHSNVWDDVAFSLRNLGTDPQEIKRRVDHALGILHAENLKDRPVHLLSFGEKKKVALAGALTLDAKVLLFDEPTSGMDPFMVQEISSILRALSTDREIIVSSHDMDFIYEICDYIYIMKKGKIIGEGTIDRIFEDEPLLEAAHLVSPCAVVYQKRERELKEYYERINDNRATF